MPCFPSDRADELRVVLERIGRGERVAAYETERITKDGRRLRVSVTFSPIEDADGRVIGASAVARDISEQARLQAGTGAAGKNARSVA